MQPAPPANADGQGDRGADFRVDQHLVLPARRRLHRLGHDAARPRRAGGWTLPELQDLLDEWVIAGWQERPHDALRDPMLPRRPLSPNEMYAALVAAAGYVPVPLTGDDYIELLPVDVAGHQRLRHPHRLPHLRLRRAAPLPPAAVRCHRQARAVGGPLRPLRPLPDLGPQPPRRLDHRSLDPPADGRAPFADFTWRHARRVAAQAGPGRHQRDRGRRRPRQPADPRRGRSTGQPCGGQGDRPDRSSHPGRRRGASTPPLERWSRSRRTNWTSSHLRLWSQWGYSTPAPRPRGGRIDRHDAQTPRRATRRRPGR